LMERLRKRSTRSSMPTWSTPPTRSTIASSVSVSAAGGPGSHQSCRLLVCAGRVSLVDDGAHALMVHRPIAIAVDGRKRTE
jgi:hypothetical protein